jgi:hypothetical protein
MVQNYDRICGIKIERVALLQFSLNSDSQIVIMVHVTTPEVCKCQNINLVSAT